MHMFKINVHSFCTSNLRDIIIPKVYINDVLTCRERDFLHRNALELLWTAHSLLCVHGLNSCTRAAHGNVGGNSNARAYSMATLYLPWQQSTTQV